MLRRKIPTPVVPVKLKVPSVFTELMSPPFLFWMVPPVLALPLPETVRLPAFPVGMGARFTASIVAPPVSVPGLLFPDKSVTVVPVALSNDQ